MYTPFANVRTAKQEWHHQYCQSQTAGPDLEKQQPSNLYMSLWQKVLPLNLGLFVYSYLFSSYYSYTKLWLLLFSMHQWVVKVKIGSSGHQEED